MKKRILSAFLCMCMVLTMVPAAFAVGDEDATSNNTIEVKNSNALSEALSSEKSGTISIELTASFSADMVVRSGQAVSLNLNGQKLTNSSSDTITVEKGGTLTITGSGTVDNITNGKAAVNNNAGGTVTLSGGTYTRSAEAGSSADNSGGNSYYTLLNHGTMTINSGVTVNQGPDGNGKFSSLIENGWYNGNQNVGKTPSTMIINVGTFSGGLNTLKNDDYGNLTIEGGTFENFAQSCFLNWNVATINGGTFNGSNSTNPVILNAHIDNTMDQGELTINSGNFTGNYLLERMTGSGNDGLGTVKITDGVFTGTTGFLSPSQPMGEGTISITGGTFSSNVKDYVATGYTCEQDGNSTTWTVSKLEGGQMEVKPGTSTGDSVSATLDGEYSNETTEITGTPSGSDTGVANNNITVDLSTDNTSSAETQTVTLNVPEATAKTLKAADSLTLKSDVGSVRLDSNALNTVSNADSAVTLTIQESDKNDSEAAAYTVTLTDGSNNNLLPYGQDKGGVTITVPVPAETDMDNIEVWYVTGDENNRLYIEQLDSDVVTVEDTQSIRYTMDHLSTTVLTTSTPASSAEATVTTSAGVTTGYATLADAVAAANNNDTVKLLKDVTVNVDNTTTSSGQGAINITRNITLDGNGKTITAGDGYAMNSGGTRGEYHVINVMSGANVTIKNLTVDGENNNAEDSPRSGINVFTGSGSGPKTDVTLENVTVMNCSTYGVTSVGSNLTVNGVTTSDNAWGGINVDNTISSATGGEFVMNSGTLNEANALYIEKTKGDGNGQKATINGGTFEGKVSIADKTDGGDVDGPSLTVKGGTFSNSVAEYVDPSIQYEVNNSGTYTYYTTAAQASSAAKAGATISAIGESGIDESAKSFTVTLNYDYNGAANVEVTVPEGFSYTLPSAPHRSGYTFRYWTDGSETYGEGEEVTIEGNTTFTAVWRRNSSSSGGSSSGGGSTSSNRYTVSVPSDIDNGSISVSPSRAERGDTVTITVKPDEGYKLHSLIALDSDGDRITIEKERENIYTFEMPSDRVTIEATFAEIEEQPTSLPFNDVSTSDWFYDEVMYAYENGIMNGMGNNQFQPNATTNRAMVVTILYRLAGSPDLSDENLGYPFADVDASSWYGDAVYWARLNGITNGISNTNFGPDGSITREQMAALLYRYADFAGYDVSTGGMSLSEYADASEISSYAVTAMQWANENGLITGRSATTLAPKGTATRAEVATILMRFCEDVVS